METWAVREGVRAEGRPLDSTYRRMVAQAGEEEVRIRGLGRGGTGMVTEKGEVVVFVLEVGEVEFRKEEEEAEEAEGRRRRRRRAARGTTNVPIV